MPGGGLWLDVKCLFDSEHFLMPNGQAEDAKDSALVYDADLNMCFVVESRTFVKFGAFHKEGSHGLVRQDRKFGFGHLPPGAMEMFDDCTIEVPLAFFRSAVLRKGFLCHRVQLYKSFVGRPHSLDTFLCGEVQASSQINHCANYGWVFNVSPGQACPLQRPDWITLPEINPRTKPIVGFFAHQKVRTAQNCLGGFDAASVAGKNKAIQTGGIPALICRPCRNNHPS